MKPPARNPIAIRSSGFVSLYVSCFKAPASLQSVDGEDDDDHEVVSAEIPHVVRHARARLGERRRARQLPVVELWSASSGLPNSHIAHPSRTRCSMTLNPRGTKFGKFRTSRHGNMIPRWRQGVKWVRTNSGSGFRPDSRVSLKLRSESVTRENCSMMAVCAVVTRQRSTAREMTQAKRSGSSLGGLRRPARG